MGNTSDRVSGDRHGAKAHRSDSGGSHKDQEISSSKMVDSTDDPNIFNTHGSESKVILFVPQKYLSLRCHLLDMIIFVFLVEIYTHAFRCWERKNLTWLTR